MPRTLLLPALAMIILSPVATAHADQEACEARVRALMAPYGNNAPAQVLNRFGTSVTTFGETEMRGYSLQTAEGSLYYDQERNPVSLSFANGDVYTTADSGKTWTLANATPKEVMDAVIAGVISQAEKATNITCEEGVDLDGRLVNHYGADFEIYNTGTPTRSEYWVDPETGFVWRDTMHSKGDPEVLVTVDAEPAPEMTLPDPTP